jgi:RNA polymerase sigma factor (sigma-70 family)
MDMQAVIDSCYPADTFEAAEQRADLRTALGQLTDKQREAALLHLAGYTQREIGAMLGVGHQRVSKRLIAAQKTIAKYVEEGGQITLDLIR